MNLDSTWMEAIKECYANADHWSTRRQILSVVADKMSFKEIKTWIPDLFQDIAKTSQDITVYFMEEVL